MTKKNLRTTSDYLDFDRAINKSKSLLKDEKTRIFGFFIMVAINTGLRISDILTLNFEDFKSETIIIKEKKTGKTRTIALNDNIKSAVTKYFNKEKGKIFISQKSSIFTTQQLNRKLKQVFSLESKTLNISSHSLRKTFGRRVFYKNSESEKALIYLSELFNHQNVSITRVYLGLRQEELNNIYRSL